MPVVRPTLTRHRELMFMGVDLLLFTVAPRTSVVAASDGGLSPCFSPIHLTANSRQALSAAVCFRRQS